MFSLRLVHFCSAIESRPRRWVLRHGQHRNARWVFWHRRALVIHEAHEIDGDGEHVDGRPRHAAHFEFPANGLHALDERPVLGRDLSPAGGAVAGDPDPGRAHLALPSRASVGMTAIAGWSLPQMMTSTFWPWAICWRSSSSGTQVVRMMGSSSESVSVVAHKSWSSLPPNRRKTLLENTVRPGFTDPRSGPKTSCAAC